MWKIPYFKILYSTSFTILLLITIALLVVSPIDISIRSFRNDQRYNIIIISGVYVAVFIVTLFIYATRLYTTRTHLASIPKFRAPLQKGDLPKSVRRLILDGIERNAGVAFKARPRDLTGEDWETSEVNATRGQPDAEPVPTWGTISHPGCSAPHDAETPGMHYESVLIELPHLLEARAVSLAPPDPFFVEPEDMPLDQEQPQPLPDPRVVSLLQRSPATSLRAYVAQLADFDVLESIEQAANFVQRYEMARFSGEPLFEQNFRALMESFALVLDTMQEPDPAMIDGLAEGDESMSTMSGRDSGRSVLHNSNPSQISLSIRQQRSIASLVTHSSSKSVVRTQSRPQTHGTGISGSSLDASQDFATPGLTPGLRTETPFHTPYPTAVSTKTASTGSLAGSEGTVQTARSRAARTSRSGKRTPSAFSRRSRKSRRSRSRSAFGLGLDVDEGDERGYERDTNSDLLDGQASTSRNVIHDSAQERGRDRATDALQHFLSEEGSARRGSLAKSQRAPSESASGNSAGSLVVRRGARKTEPGMISLE